MRRTQRVLLLSAFLSLGITAARADDYPHLLFGNPSKATTEPKDRDNLLMKKEFFALAYNDEKGSPNWVSWRLLKSDLGSAPRKPFYPDATLPRGYRRVTPKDYSNSGFDRGHMCPHSDRGGSEAASEATFVMTNIVPQAPKLNQGPWNDLEIYCRALVARHHKRLYIVCGPHGEGGTGHNGLEKAIARGRVAVPAQCWKIILVLPDGDGNDIEKVLARTRVIAVTMPNSEHVKHDWAGYRTSVRNVEELTGYTFFDRLPADLRKVLRDKVDDDPIHQPAERHPREE